MKELPVFTELMSLGFSLTEKDGQLHYRAPEGALTPETLGRLKAEKQAILTYLRENRAGKVDRLSGTQDELKRSSSGPGTKIWVHELLNTQPTDACLSCGQNRWWMDRFGNRKCGVCHPQFDRCTGDNSRTTNPASTHFKEDRNENPNA